MIYLYEFVRFACLGFGYFTFAILPICYHCRKSKEVRMAEELDGEEFVVDKILDKRVRNGKIEYYLSWKVTLLIRVLMFSS